MSGPWDPGVLAAEVGEFQRRLGTSLAALARLPPPVIATAPREVVRVDGPSTLYRYHGEPRRGAPPLLMVFSLVNRPTVLDLQPDRSMIRSLLAAGVDVYLLDWGTPGRADRHTTLADYVLGTLGRAVADLRARHGEVDLLGVCQGGTLALLYAASRPAEVRRLVTMVAPVDFATPGDRLSTWARGLDVARLVEAFGNIPGELLNAAFVGLMPFRLTLQKYLALVDGADDPRALETFVRMEQWIQDSPDQAGAAFREFVTDYVQGNRLVHGTATLGGAPVDLGRLAMPILNVYATRDHLVPPASARALGRLAGSRAYREYAFDGGHIGLYVSARAHAVPTAVAEWLAAGRSRRGAR